MFHLFQTDLLTKLYFIPHVTLPTIARQRHFAEGITSGSDSRRNNKGVSSRYSKFILVFVHRPRCIYRYILVNVIKSLFLYLRGFSSSILPELFFICHCQPQAYSTWSYVLELSPGTDSDITAFPDVLVIPTRPVPRIADLNGAEIA